MDHLKTNLNNLNYFKWCYVPECKNTSRNNPLKIFFYVPQNIEKIQLCFKVARRADESTNSKFYCCEDHFDVIINI